jgi:murein tripeptide amidase MpaA
LRFSAGLLCFSHHRRPTQTSRANALLRHGYEDGWKPRTIEYYENDSATAAKILRSEYRVAEMRLRDVGRTLPMRRPKRRYRPIDKHRCYSMCDL